MRFVVFKEKIRIVTQLSVFFGTPSGNLACATIPDKQWVSTVYPKGKLQAIFSLIRFPYAFFYKIKDGINPIFYFGTPSGNRTHN